MRDKNLSFIQFCQQVEKFVERKLQLPELLRTTVIDSPTFPDQFTIVYPRKFKDLQGLTLIHWWLPEKLMWEIHLGLWELSLNHLNEKQKIEIKLMLSSREICLKYLYKTERYTSHEIFGNLLMSGVKTMKYLRLFKRSTKVKRVQRKRGYDDKGSLRPTEKWLPDFDFTLTALQNEKEKINTRRYKIINRLKEYLENLLIE